MTDLRTTAAVGAGWTAVQKWLVRALSVLTFIVVSRLLSPAEIGLAALGLAFLGVFGVITDMGASTFLVQTRAWDEPTRSTVFWTMLVLSALGTALVVGLAAPLSALLGEPRLTGVLRAMAPMLMVSGPTAVPTAVLVRNLRFRQLAVRESVSALVAAVVGMSLALEGAGVWALVAQNGAQSLIAATLVWHMSGWRPTGQVSGAALTELRRFGLPLLAVNVMQSVRDRLEQFLLGVLLGMDALGYWAVAVRLLSVLVDVSVAVLDVVALPIFAATRSQTERFVRALESAVSSAQVLVVPVLVGLAVVSPSLIPLVFGRHWAAAIPPAQVLCLAYGIAGLAYFNRGALLSHGRAGVECLLTATSLTVHLGIVLLVAPWGLTVLAWAFTAEGLATVVLGAVVLRATLGIPLATLYRGARVVGCGLLAAAVALATRYLLALGEPVETVVALSGAGAVLAAALWWTSRHLLREVVSDIRRLLHPRVAA